MLAVMAPQVLIPQSAEEAVSLYGDGEGITVFAGGTILMPELASGRLKPERALLLHASGLAGIRADGGVLRIGATTPVAALVDGPVPRLLSDYAAHVADAEVRRSATIGGNVCAPPGRESQRGDLGAALIALGARVRSTGKGGERMEAVEDFLAGDRSSRLVLELELDEAERRTGGAGMRRRHAHSYAIANVAVAERDGELRVAVAGAGPTAVRCRSVEASRDPADVLQDVEPVDDAVATAQYRREILPLLVRQAFDRLENA
jgi:aerobic carbon-monoxide dehydrogenase medium subunit